MPHITPQRTVDIALGIIRKKILRGDYPVGSLLPSERTLAEELGINRLTLRSALGRLESEKLIQPHHGRGIVVLDYKTHSSIDILAHLNDDTALQGFFALRRNMAAEAAAQACIHASIHQLNELRDICIAQQQSKDDEEFLYGDIAFTKTLVTASKNTALQLLFNSFERILLGQKEASYKSLKHKEGAIASYHALIALIRNRNPLLCRKAILFPHSLSTEEQTEIQSALSLEYSAQ